MMSLQALAVPADPRPLTVTQPDGTQLTIQNHGDEYYNFLTTADGYTVIKNADGYYTYAQLTDGHLTATTTVARNEQQRSAADNALLGTLGKGLVDKTSASSASKVRSARVSEMKKSPIDYNKFRGLIILVEFNDCSFKRSDVSTFFGNMVNKTGYTGYTNEDGSTNAYGTFTGSVRDYFYDNSQGQFSPQFDIYGPVKVDYSVNDPNQTKNAQTIVRAAIQAAYTNYGIDFSKYDVNNDKVVDMFYMIFAGTGSNVGGGQHIWPHASSISTRLGGYTLSRYACSTELYYESPLIFDGIGTICHEFSHVLGLPDLYDTDYEENGSSHDPGVWDIMAGGSYLNYSRTPCGYSAYDRYAAGFMTPTVVTAGSQSLKSIDNNVAYRLNTNGKKEFYLLENRQLKGWDAYLPGHGLIIARVDSTSSVYWLNNKVNAYTSRNCYELLRAGGSTSGAVDSDPFPGTKGVTIVSNTTTPGLISPYLKNTAEYAINDITEENGVIKFNTINESDILSVVEDFENMAVGTSTSMKNVEGNFCKWSFTRCQVSAPASDRCNGSHAVAMSAPSILTTTSRTGKDVKMVTARIFNPGSTTAKFLLEYSVDNGNTWTAVRTSSDQEYAEISGPNTGINAIWNLQNASSEVLYRLTQRAGSQTAKVYVDDFTIYYTTDFSGVADITPDGASALKATGNNGTVTVSGATEGTVHLYGVSGQLVQSAQAVDGKAQFAVGTHGVYIVEQAGKAVKVVL